MMNFWGWLNKADEKYEKHVLLRLKNLQTNQNFKTFVDVIDERQRNLYNELVLCASDSERLKIVTRLEELKWIREYLDAAQDYTEVER